MDDRMVSRTLKMQALDALLAEHGPYREHDLKQANMQAALEATRGNKTAAARLLGVHYDSILYRSTKKRRRRKCQGSDENPFPAKD